MRYNYHSLNCDIFRFNGKMATHSDMAANISRNLAIVRERIKVACLKRPPGLQNSTPRLVAVSKTKPKELIIEAYKHGQIHFGENYVKELDEKGNDAEILNLCPDIKWHFIGHLQANKVNKLLTVPNLFMIETVDSEKLASTLNKSAEKLRSGNKLEILVQVNTSGEEEKSGCSPEEVVRLTKFIVDSCPNLKFSGLMTIGKYDNYDTVKGINPDFKCLVDCGVKVCNELGIDRNSFELSMGMSGDFEHAIEVGSTNVRVGSSIFGSRN